MEKLTDYEKELIRQSEKDFAAGRYCTLEEVEVKLNEKIRVAKLMLKQKKGVHAKKVRRPSLATS